MIGRESLESLLLGTPIVVPEGTVAAEHAELANGGLWYRDYHELFAAARALLADRSLRDALGEQGRSWAEAVWEDQAGAGAAAQRLVFGGS